MASARRSCRNNPDMFCHICRAYTIAPNRKPVTSFITRAYHAYFGIKLADQDKAWVPHMVWKACTKALRGWTNGKRILNFGIPMVWREPTNHVTDCFFCAHDVTGIDREDRDSLKYPYLQSACHPVAHCQRTLLNCWHPDWRKKTSFLTVLTSASSTTGIKSTSVFSLE